MNAALALRICTACKRQRLWVVRKGQYVMYYCPRCD